LLRLCGGGAALQGPAEYHFCHARAGLARTRAFGFIAIPASNPFPP
jgi:hypothetical protein